MTTLEGLTLDTSPIFRRVIQAVCDLSRRPLDQLRVLDLGSAHGSYTLELAGRGAEVLGIEGRESWLEQANRSREDAGISSASFIRDDVRNLRRDKYGEFDVVLCLGLLYHLPAPDVFDFIGRLAEVTRPGGFAVVETIFATKPAESRGWRGRTYCGRTAPEHPVGASREQKLKDLGASLDNETSFWLTLPSLLNILRHIGFTSVFDVRNPVACLYVGEERAFKVWGNRVTLVAVRGEPVSLSAAAETDWPEDWQEHRFEDYLERRNRRGLRRITGRLFP